LGGDIMNQEKNNQAPNDEPPPATPDIIKEGVDTERQEPPPATQDILECAEEPPKAKPDIMMKMLTQKDLEKLIIEQENEEEEKK